MAKTDLGADLTIDKTKLKTPVVLQEASDHARANMNLGETPEQTERIIAQRSQPHIERMQQQFESQGLRWSTERRDKTARRLGEHVIVPQLERVQNQKNAAVQTAIQAGDVLGRQAYQSEALGLEAAGLQADVDLRERGLEQEESQFARELSQRESQFGRDLSQRDRELAQRGDQFDRDLAARESQFADSMKLKREEFVEVKRQWNAADERQKDQFAKELGVRRDELDESIRQFDEQTRIQEEQFAKTFTLDEINSAATRASATGTFTDPVTGISYDTLQKRKVELDHIVSRAAAIGSWIEMGVEIDMAAIFTSLGLEADDFLGPSTGEGAPADPDAKSADDAKAEAESHEEHTLFLSTLPDLAADIGTTSKMLEDLTKVLGRPLTEEVLGRLKMGDRISVDDLVDRYGPGVGVLSNIMVGYYEDGVLYGHLPQYSNYTPGGDPGSDANDPVGPGGVEPPPPGEPGLGGEEPPPGEPPPGGGATGEAADGINTFEDDNFSEQGGDDLGTDDDRTGWAPSLLALEGLNQATTPGLNSLKERQAVLRDLRNGTVTWDQVENSNIDRTFKDWLEQHKNWQDVGDYIDSFDHRKQWTSEGIQPIVDGLKNGSISDAQIEAMDIPARYKGHFYKVAGIQAPYHLRKFT